MNESNIVQKRIEEFISAHCELAIVNCSIGYWDMKRFALRNKSVEEIDVPAYVDADRKVRQWVERRATLKNSLDRYFGEMIKGK